MKLEFSFHGGLTPSRSRACFPYNQGSVSRRFWWEQKHNLNRYRSKLQCNIYHLDDFREKENSIQSRSFQTNRERFFPPSRGIFPHGTEPRDWRLLRDNKDVGWAKFTLPRRPAQGLKWSIGFVLTPGTAALFPIYANKTDRLASAEARKGQGPRVVVMTGHSFHALVSLICLFHQCFLA